MDPKELSNEDLANIIRAMRVTGICPSYQEKEYLDEAANRLEKLGEIERWINNTVEKMKEHLNIKNENQ